MQLKKLFMLKEVFYYFEGLDESIEQLNKYLVDDHFEFKKYTIPEFKEKFKTIIQIRETGSYDDTIEASLGFSLGFAIGLDDLKYFNQSQIVNDKNVVFLRYVEFEEDKLTKTIEGESDNFENEVNNRVKKIIEKLKLLKSGHIKLISAFEFTTDLGCIPISYSHSSKNKNYLKYFLNDNDIVEFKALINQLEISSSSYLSLAINSFFESYNIENERLRFVMLMICLESILAKKGEIMKTLPPYTALIIENQQNLNERTERIEFLYD